MTIELIPKDGWKQFKLNTAVSDFLYSHYSKELKIAGWKYLNFTSDTAIFEDPLGNTVYLEFSKPDKEKHDLIEKIIFEYSSIKDSPIQSLESNIANRFKLERINRKTEIT